MELKRDYVAKIERYKSDNLGSAQVSFDKSKVNLSNVPSGSYLVVQNSDGAAAKAVSGTTSVFASDMGLSGFDNCKVWLETTDTTNRMACATLATEEQGFTVNVTLADGMEIASGSLTQKVSVNQKMSDIVINAKDGYFFPEDYVVAGQNGITLGENGKSSRKRPQRQQAKKNVFVNAVVQKKQKLFL